MTNQTTDLEKIRILNDRCRLGLDRHARILFTASCLAAFSRGDTVAEQIAAQAGLMAAIGLYVFTDDDGPEHDRGQIEIGDTTVRFKIDYYDLTLEWGSEDPANPAVTCRVLTIMLPEDD